MNIANIFSDYIFGPKKATIWRLSPATRTKKCDLRGVKGEELQLKKARCVRAFLCMLAAVSACSSSAQAKNPGQIQRRGRFVPLPAADLRAARPAPAHGQPTAQRQPGIALQGLE